jgi:hypothetical protein
MHILWRRRQKPIIQRVFPGTGGPLLSEMHFVPIKGIEVHSAKKAR